MNIKEAVRVFGEAKTRVSVRKELQNMLVKDVFVGIAADQHVPKELLIPSKLFLKLKAMVLSSLG